MRKLLSIVACYCLFVSLIVAALFWMPDSYRIHPRLELPTIVFLQPPVRQADNNVLLIGDSFAQLAPWPVTKRFCSGGSSIAQLTKAIQRQQVNDSITEILILAGVASLFCHDESLLNIEKDMLVLESALIQKYPNTNISKVSVTDMLQCAKEYPRNNDGLHPSPLGYEILRQRHFPTLIF